MPPCWPSLSIFFVVGLLVGDLNFGKCYFRVFLDFEKSCDSRGAREATKRTCRRRLEASWMWESSFLSDSATKVSIVRLADASSGCRFVGARFGG